MIAEFRGTLDQALAWAEGRRVEPGAKAAAAPALSDEARRWEHAAHGVKALRREVDRLATDYACADAADWHWAARCIEGLQAFCDAIEIRLVDELTGA